MSTRVSSTLKPLVMSWHRLSGLASSPHVENPQLGDVTCRWVPRYPGAQVMNCVTTQGNFKKDCTESWWVQPDNMIYLLNLLKCILIINLWISMKIWLIWYHLIWKAVSPSIDITMKSHDPSQSWWYEINSCQVISTLKPLVVSSLRRASSLRPGIVSPCGETG